MKKIMKKTALLAAVLLLLPVQLSAQNPPSSGRLARKPGLVRDGISGETGSIITVDRPVLSAWDNGDGGEDDLNGGSGNGTTDGDNNVVDGLPVRDAMYLLIVLTILYGIVARRNANDTNDTNEHKFI
jgi:hypothetical protein